MMAVFLKRLLFIGGAAGAAVILVLALMPGGLTNTPFAKASNSWKLNAIKATYVGSQLKEADKTHAILFFSYDLENDTDLDYRLTDTGVSIMRQLKSNGSLSQEGTLRLGYAAFLPARRRVRISIEDRRSYDWP